MEKGGKEEGRKRGKGDGKGREARREEMKGGRGEEMGRGNLLHEAEGNRRPCLIRVVSISQIISIGGFWFLSDASIDFRHVLRLRNS